MAKTYYLAGKITGDPDYREKFRCVQSRYAPLGPVLNPAELPEGMSPEDYMQICLTMIDRADVVIFLPDWRGSGGARIEHEYCRYTGKEIRYLEEESNER